MWIYLINFLLAVIMTALIHMEVPDIDHSGLLSVGIFFLAFIMIWLSSALFYRRYFYQLPKVIKLGLFFLKELLVANLRVSYEVLTPKNRLKPAVIAVPLDVKTDLEIMILANMITLTPGTLSLDVAADKKHLYVHTLYSDNDIIAFRKNIKEGFEKKILAISKK